MVRIRLCIFDYQEGPAASSFLHIQEFFTIVLFVHQNVSDLALALAPSALAWLVAWTSIPMILDLLNETNRIEGLGHLGQFLLFLQGHHT